MTIAGTARESSGEVIIVGNVASDVGHVLQDYDVANSSYARGLAWKYGIIWQERALKRKSIHDCPVRLAKIKHENGEVDVYPGAAFKELAAGCQLFTLPDAQLVEMHPALPQHVVHYYLPANPKDWGVCMDDHVVLNFRAHTRVLLLLPTRMREPRCSLHALHASTCHHDYQHGCWCSA